MKVLTVIQPFAWLIIRPDLPSRRAVADALAAHRYPRIKNIENRQWRTTHRGELAIHAGQKFDDAGAAFVRRMFPEIPLPHASQCIRGGIIGVALLVDCVTRSQSPWFNGPYGFVLEDPRPCSFVPMRGRLGLFDVDDGLIQCIR